MDTRHSQAGHAGQAYSLWQMVGYALRLGTIGFGGPVALVGYMHRDLVERRRWISEADYKEGLTLAQLVRAARANAPRAMRAMRRGYRRAPSACNFSASAFFAACSRRHMT